jgi:TonB-linked SusC/RagA family outer membrane protein
MQLLDQLSGLFCLPTPLNAANCFTVFDQNLQLSHMRRLLFTLLGVLGICLHVFAQTRTITGRITDAQGNAVANASVSVKGTTSGTTTATDGSFTLSVPENARDLVVSSVGYANLEVPINNRTNINISMNSTEQSMNEVVVVAYGTAKKRTFTGSASTISSADIGKQQISTFTRALEGTVPGIQVTSGSGQPGSGSAIRIRGIGSINASSAPLYVVDGVPYGGDFNAINPTDIETISVLKDAASTALYGARGANGVILITTKRGKGKPRIELQTRYGVNDRGVPEYEVIRDPGQFLQVYWEVLRNEGINRQTGALSEAQAGLYASQAMFGAARLNNYNPYSVPAGQYVIDPATGLLNPNAKLLYADDWEDAMFERRPRQEHIATVSGSNDKTQYYLSVGYLNDKGYIVRSDFDRLTTRLRLDQGVNNFIKAGINLSYARSEQNNTQAGNTTYQNAFYFTRRVAPVYPVWVRDASGNFVLDSKGNRIYDFGAGVAQGSQGTRTFAGTENPRATLDLDIRNREADNLSGRTYVEITPLKDLTLTLNYGVDLNVNKNISFQNPTYGNAIGVSGRSTVSNGRNNTENFNQLLNYRKSLGEHNFDFLAGHESYKLTLDGQSATKELFLFPGTAELNAGAVNKDANTARDFYNVEGYFTQLRYDYKNRYFASASYRRDGSSRFAEGNEWGNFWSVGAGWSISEENFLKDVNFLDLLKLKFSTGEKGNDALNYVGSSLTGVNYYPYVDQYTIASTGSTNLTLAYRGNPEITWEKNRDVNIGLEFGLFKRITGSFEYFKRTTEDLLFPNPLALSTGVQSIPDNIGSMWNKGVEAELNFDILRGRDLRWNVGVNATHWKNQITELPPLNSVTGIVSGNNKLLPGHSIYEYFIEQSAGVDPSTGLALYYKDEIGVSGVATGRKVVTSNYSEATRYYLGKTSTPDVTGGVNTTIAYKGFDLSILTSYAIGGWIYDSPYQGLMTSGGGDIQTWHVDILKRWQAGKNTNTSVPRLQEGYQNANSRSDRWLIRGDYFNLRNVVVGYNIPSEFTSRYNIGGIRFYAVADNVWLNSRRQGLDPRQDFDGSIGNVYSPIRTVSVGLNVTF